MKKTIFDKHSLIVLLFLLLIGGVLFSQINNYKVLTSDLSIQRNPNFYQEYIDFCSSKGLELHVGGWELYCREKDLSNSYTIKRIDGVIHIIDNQYKSEDRKRISNSGLAICYALIDGKELPCKNMNNSKLGDPVADQLAICPGYRECKIIAWRNNTAETCEEYKCKEEGD